jgi:micrococcal nuclease
MAKKTAKKSIFVSDYISKIGLSPKVLTTILGIIALTGGTYGGYTIYRDISRTNSPDMQPVYMSRVLDGDTFELESGETIRLSEINAPEISECYGPEAKAELEKLLRGLPLRLVKDIQGADNYGRLIRYVVVENSDPRADNILVNRYIIEKGFAKYSPNENNLYQNKLIATENMAQSQQLGLWKNCPQEKTVTDDTRNIEPTSQPTDSKCVIKGNISDIGYGRKYLLPGCPNYNTVKIDPKKGEGYFCTEAEAQKAGFTKNESCLSTGK